jgi:dethiobiotin synthetase
MAGRLIVVTGTGTGIGKTHFAEALLLAWQRRAPRVAGWKPVESGVAHAGPLTDAERLRRASTFHVKQAPHAFPEPLSPHLAARLHGVILRAEDLLPPIARLRAEADVVVVELPGGLFTPIAAHLLNAELAARMSPDAVLLVAPDRLGVLHDVTAAVRASRTVPLALAGIVLVAPDLPDASTGSNAAELGDLAEPPVLVTLPRALPAQLAPHAEAVIRHLAN